MKRNKSPDGYRNKILQVRLTEVENAAFQILYEKAKINNEGLLVSDFIRQQLLYESNDKEAYEMPHNMELIRAFLIKIESSINYKVALSFVETKEDIEDFVELCGNQKIISKIESQKAIDNLDEIMKYSEHIMLGRGDLLFNTKLESFLHNQVTVIKKCNENNKDIIVSTGILTSMKNELLPARAELIDLILLNELGVHSINLSSHILQSENIDKVVELINSLNGNQSY